jgi:hypothetical protein
VSRLRSVRSRMAVARTAVAQTAAAQTAVARTAAMLDVALIATAVPAERESVRLIACAPLLRWIWQPLQLVAVPASFHRWLRAEEHFWSPSRRYASVRAPGPAGAPGPVVIPETGRVPVAAPLGVPVAIDLSDPAACEQQPRETTFPTFPRDW